MLGMLLLLTLLADPLLADAPQLATTTGEPFDAANLIPNYDHIAGTAGFNLWYRDRAGQPLAQQDKVFTTEGEQLTIDFAPVRPLSDGGVLLVELVPEDLTPGRRYTLAVDVKAFQPFTMQVTVPGKITSASVAVSEQNDAIALVAISKPWFKRETVTFEYQPPPEGKTTELSLFLRSAKTKVMLRRWALHEAE